MDAGLQEQVSFHLTGRRPGAGLEPIAGLGLRPALLAGYRDLTRLRYDYPLVLVAAGEAAAELRPLSAVVDDLVAAVAGGEDADRLTHQALRVEQEIRSAVAAGASGSLVALWDAAAARLVDSGDDTLRDGLARLRRALTVDGTVVDCDAAAPDAVVRHLWAGREAARAARARAEIERLARGLTDILRVDAAHSEAGRTPDRLRAGIGDGDAGLFDFDAMSRLLGRSAPEPTLPESRRRRIEQLLAALTAQRFFGPADGDLQSGTEPFSFTFDDCASALAAYRARLPEQVELARTLAVAALEVDGEYREERHDALFADFGANGLDVADRERFPASLVCVAATRVHGAERDALLEILAGGLPIKVLVRTDDLFDGSDGGAHLDIGRRSRELTGMALGLNEPYVLQASASHLYRVRDRIRDGLSGDGPALFSVFSGAGSGVGDLPPYLVAAAAVESRAFPAFSFDPAAGDTWADRFSLAANPQPEQDWPSQPFAYEDEEHQRVEARLAFTLADFAACDSRFARHFARLPRAAWHAGLLPVEESLGTDAAALTERVPAIVMVDDQDRLQRVLVESRLVAATRRCRDAWHSLQELGGIHNSHAERLLAAERAAWEERERALAAAVVATPAPPTASPVVNAAPAGAAVAPAVEAPSAPPEPAHSPDEAWVETERCTSCNECTLINSKLFTYDENKQCHIADLDAGTYRDLVEAAENCQVAIIHPGKPRNPKEPGLEELIARAQPFL